MLYKHNIPLSVNKNSNRIAKLPVQYEMTYDIIKLVGIIIFLNQFSLYITFFEDFFLTFVIIRRRSNRNRWLSYNR